MISNPAARDLAKSRLEAVEFTLAVATKELQALIPEDNLSPEEHLDLLLLAEDASKRLDILYSYLSKETWKHNDRLAHPSHHS